ncbi:MAG: large-conductance mechanosensitive channel protein MscL [Erysipelothrix sp.]|nr:large-conductance mechanosensitive channel protein MscL [Erysipelothrix sp.]
MKLIKEFKDFINKGNALDLAIGVIIGTAFSAIVNSIVNDLFMPFISFILGGLNLSDRRWILVQGADDASTIAISYGNFIQQVINFLAIGFIVFLIVKALNSLRRKQEVKKEEPVTPEEIILLREIRDEMKKQHA